MNLSKTKLLTIIHAVVLVVGIVLALVIPSKITAGHVVSVCFTAVAYAVFALLHIALSSDSRQNTVQNAGILTMAGIYLAVTAVVSLLMDLIRASVKFHVIVDVIILVAGLVACALMYMAKQHIENQ